MTLSGVKSKEEVLKLMKKTAYEVKFDLQNTNYLPLENIGIGAYGVVCSAIYSRTKARVAIKKIPHIFDDKRVATRTYREIKILKHFKHDNIISIRDILKPKENISQFKEVYVVFDLMESDLHKIIYSKQELSEEHIRYFLYQLLRGLKYIHSANVIHRDLKPSNLLVNEDCQLRIGDFGMARGVNMSPEEPNHFMTQYVATRWYRAPEIMLALIEYGTAVDMWSVGCIFAEMLGRKHLFPGKDYINQIKLIVGVLGSPSPDLLKLCQSDLIKKFILQLGKKESISWNTLFPKASRKAINLLSKMLLLHPGERISVDEALKHPYLSKYHDPDDEPICVPTFNFDFEKKQAELNTEKLRELIFKEIMEYHEPRTPTLSFNAFLVPVPKACSSTVAPSPSQSSSEQREIIAEKTVKSSELQIVPSIPGKTADENKKSLLQSESESKVSVDTSTVVASMNDVEMLSAKNESFQGVLGDSNVSQDNKVDPKKGDNKQQENKTISSDTKALIKAALLNANLKKQRNDSTNEADEKPKPVTAAQRQREREEKRRKKKEKAIERMRKNKEKKEQKKDQLLTDEDRELLQRWAKMQKANHPIAPKPDNVGSSLEANATSQTFITNIPTGQSSIIQGNLPQQVTNNSQTTSQKQQLSFCNQSNQSIFASNQSQTLQPQTSKSVQFIPGSVAQTQSSTSNSSGKSLINVDTMHMLQQKLHARSSQSNNSQVQQASSSTDIETEVPPVTGTDGEQSVSSGLSTINMDNLKMLGMSNASEMSNSFQSKPYQESLGFQKVGNTVSVENDARKLPSSFMQSRSQNTTSDYAPSFHEYVSHGSPYSDQDSPKKDYSNHSSPEHYQSHGSPEQYNQDSNSSADHSSRRSSFPDPSNSPSHQQTSPQPGYTQSVSQQFNLSNINHIGQNSQNSASLSNTNTLELNQVHDFSSSFAGQNQNMSFSPGLLDREPAYGDRQNIYQQDHNISNNTNVSFSSDISNSVRNVTSRNSLPLQLYDDTNSEGRGFTDSLSDSGQNLSRHSLPPQFYNLQSNSGQEPRPGPSGTQQISYNASSPPDLISLLSKQLSRSQVEDPCPPALALTPRGTGAGYGLGMDLDALMVDAQIAESIPPQPSPLSSSLLTDWMEVTGDLNIDMDALEQELSLQSPMSLSYNDLSMYPS